MHGDWQYDVFKHTHREALRKAERSRLVRFTIRPTLANYTPMAVRLGRFLVSCGQRLEARYTTLPSIEANFLAQ
jgi:hypothetical protein